MFLLCLGIVTIIVGAALQFLRHSFTKQWVKLSFNWEPEGWFDTVSFYLIPFLAVIGLIAIVLTYHSRKIAEESLHDSQMKILTLEEKELWRPWAMIVPTGEIAGDIYGINLERSSTRSKRHQEIFIREGSKISFDLNQCPNQEYRDKIKKLITDYPYVPYAYVAFSWCLKRIGNPSWKQEAERAKEILEKLIEIKPHVTAIDGYYMFLMGNVLETAIEENRFWDRGEMGEYRPKGMPY
jgi:hypothetical protein